MTRLKKGKQQRLVTRASILTTYGLRSRERITIDEEINSMLKIFDADMKRLRGIFDTYKEKKADVT